MRSWKPIEKSELEVLIQVQLSRCSADQRATYESFSIRLKKYPLVQNGELDSVFVAALKNGEAMYWNDIEEGWNFSPVSEKGGILEYWCNQDELEHALTRWATSVS